MDEEDNQDVDDDDDGINDDGARERIPASPPLHSRSVPATHPWEADNGASHDDEPGECLLSLPYPLERGTATRAVLESLSSDEDTEDDEEEPRSRVSFAPPFGPGTPSEVGVYARIVTVKTSNGGNHPEGEETETELHVMHHADLLGFHDWANAEVGLQSLLECPMVKLTQPWSPDHFALLVHHLQTRDVFCGRWKRPR